MAELGQYNSLRIIKLIDIGAFVDGGKDGEILLPKKYVTPSMQVDDKIDVFVYNDSEDRVVATTITPKVQLEEFAYLQVKEVNQYGAF